MNQFFDRYNQDKFLQKKCSIEKSLYTPVVRLHVPSIKHNTV